MDHRKRMKGIMISMVIILTLSFTGCGNKAKSYYDTAKKNYENGNYEKADENFAKAISLKSDNADYYIDYAFCLMKLEKYDEAAATFQKAILDKHNTIVDRNNKKAYRGLGVLYYLKGDYQNSLNNFQKAMEYKKTLNEYDMDILSYMGSLNLLLGQPEEAYANYDQILKKKPKDVKALLGRAKVNYTLTNYEDSIKDYLSAKNLNPSNFDIYFGLYEAYMAANNKEAAEQILEDASNIKGNESKDNKDSKYRYNLAKVHYYQGKLDQALDEFIGVSEDGYVESNYFVGDIYYSNGDYASAITYYERYRDAKDYVDANFDDKLSTCYLQVGEYEKALSTIEHSMTLGYVVNLQNLLRNEVIALEQTGDFEQAYSKLENYLKQYPDDEDAKRDMEFLATRQGNGSESVSDEQPQDDIVKP